ncbi:MULTISPECIES: GAF domain-containing protein [unclassified Burkholderia]|uniref:GAF domain-containing protein n=1 Tax=unclassified Burkholderia TaxID=2613784 RepID=UPI002AB03C24|nr:MULTISPECIES: GAF domain-containing protein [unclassified Burkholderia]
MTHEHTFEYFAQVADELGRTASAEVQWSLISRLAESVFGYSLLTGLVYLPEPRLMRRIFSTDEAVSPVGGFKSTGKGPWSARVLDQGLPYIGSNENDIHAVFSEAELLISQGLHSVLNLPIWCAGSVIGSLNLLHHRNAYDHVEERLIQLVSCICTPTFLLLREAEKEAASSVDISKLDSV